MSTRTEAQGLTKHPIDLAAAKVGGRQELAGVLGVKPSAIGNWKVRGVPLEHCAAIERTTAGAVTRAELRPDDYWLIWPDLPAPAHATPEKEASHA